MALRNKSLFLYGLQVTALNSSLDFRAVNAGPELNATLRLGYYSLTGLCEEIARAMNAVDTSNTYVCTANRNIGGGLENRITIATGGTYLDLLFGTGSRFGTSIRTLIGFPAADKTGDTTYTGNESCGTVLVPELVGYNYVAPERMQKIFGSVNVSASGVKEAIVYQTQQFWQVDFRYEPEAKVESQWAPFLLWAIKQRPLEFTPDVTDPLTYLEGTLESTEADSGGLAFTMSEMLPQFPFYYRTGIMKFRKRVI